MASTWEFLGLAVEADWVEAWATVAAAGGTIGAFVWQARLLKQERQTRRAEVARLQADQRENQEAQARTIVLHDASCYRNHWSVGEEERPEIIGAFMAQFGNYGGLPVTHVVPTLTYLPSGAEILPDSDHGPHPQAVLTENLRLSWDLRKYAIPWPAGFSEGQGRIVSLFRCEVAFTDVHGVRWAVRPGLGQQPFRVFKSAGVGGVESHGLGHRVRAAAKALRGS